jgi:hypothetical protein
MKKCTKCKVPLEGIMFKISSKLFGVKPSQSQEGVCNKCEDKREEPAQTEAPAAQAPEQTQPEQTQP